MRMSCNGCRVLRKGCSDECELRPCLEWIKSSESQANATLFLAKFYGRAGLINLINAGPIHVRPDIFRSLLFEACGRIINPIYGSVGLMASGNWQRCQAAVEAVLKCTSQVPDDVDTMQDPIKLLFQGCNIRHLSRETKTPLHRVISSRNRSFKRSGGNKSCTDSMASEYLSELDDVRFTITGWDDKVFDNDMNREPSHDSVETVELALVNKQTVKPEPSSRLELELTLSLHRSFIPTTVIEISDSEE